VAEERSMAAALTTHDSHQDWSFSLHVFLYLQVLDAMTTWLGFRLGLAEGSPFVRLLMHWGPLAGVLASKAVALGLGALCVWRRRYHVIHLINYWYAALAIWNLTLIVTRPH
jgi:Domain of unknown function (DUF5658)